MNNDQDLIQFEAAFKKIEKQCRARAWSVSKKIPSAFEVSDLMQEMRAEAWICYKSYNTEGIDISAWMMQAAKLRTGELLNLEFRRKRITEEKANKIAMLIMNSFVESDDEIICLKIALENIMLNHLDARQNYVCKMLMNGYNKYNIAKSLDIHPLTVERILKKIRSVCENQELTV